MTAPRTAPGREVPRPVLTGLVAAVVAALLAALTMETLWVLGAPSWLLAACGLVGAGVLWRRAPLGRWMAGGWLLAFALPPLLLLLLLWVFGGSGALPD